MITLHIMLFISYMHPLHLSVCNIDISESGEKNQIAVHLFIDDFEVAVYRKTGQQLLLNTEGQLPNADEFAKAYIFSKIKIYGKDKKEVEKYNFTKYKIEDLAVWWFFEFQLPENTKKLTIVNSLMTDIFMDQKNMTFVKYKGNENAYLFDYKDREKRILLP